MSGEYHSQREARRFGTPIRTRVKPEVAAGLLAESKRIDRDVGHIACMILEYWYEDVFVPTQKAKEK